MKFELTSNYNKAAVIKVIGVGGGGGNAVNHMVEHGAEGIKFICANTDAQALSSLGAHTMLQLGGEITKGLGAGANPEIGKQAALEDRERIEEVLEDTDMVFITAGMGGGTGTGAAPVIAEVAKSMNVLTVAVVTRPFSFEGNRRADMANKGIDELAQSVDSLITIPNEKLLPVLGKDISLISAFNAANDVLLGAVLGVSELITRPGLINVDFADVRTVMTDMGLAMMGTGMAKGENRATDAAKKAINSPLLEDVSLQGAQGVLVNVTGDIGLTMGEFSEVGDTIREFASDDADVVVGTAIDPTIEDQIRVTVVATGLGQDQNLDAPIPLVQKNNNGEVDYDKLDRPTVIRHQKDNNKSPSFTSESNQDMDLDYLDIPAFLRRQAD